VSNRFFLTRQTANLMEDFVRELKADAKLFLLYGASGVGKTRLLQELAQSRLDDSKLHWIDLQAGASGNDALVDSSAMVEDVFAMAQPGDIIIADHFEKALQKTRHQLFLSWSTDGVDKQVNLIIAGEDRFFDEMRQLAKQYQVPAQSFQLMALNPEEAAAFLGFYLFPDRPIGKLSIPPLLQEHLALTQGAVDKIVEIAERAGDQITTAPLDDVETLRKDSKNIVGILIGLALVIGCAWYYLSSQSSTDDLPSAAKEMPAQPESVAAVEAVVQQESESMPAIAPPDANQAESEARAAGEMLDDAAALSGGTDVETVVAEQRAENQTPPAEAESVADETPAEASVEMTPPAGTVSHQQSVLMEEPDPQPAGQPGANDAGAVTAGPAAENPLTAPEPVPSAPVVASRFDRELQASLDWIKRSDEKTGTIQIMLLSLDKFDDRAYYEYVDYLATRGVDSSALKVFMTYTGGRKAYSFVYGEYPSWQAAGDAIEELPQVLRDTSPIPRSAGGLMDEIRRLEAQN
jgi:septal ring-binding cell division protein DamX